MTFILKTIRGAALVASLPFVIAIADVQTAAAADRHGAISFSQDTGAIGWSYDFSSRSGAERRANSECSKHGRGCRIATWFKNACGALAVGNGNAYGGAWGNTQSQAELKAMKLCSAEARNCTVRRWVCTGR